MARKNTIKIGSGGIKGTAGFKVTAGNYARQKAYGFIDTCFDADANTYFTTAGIIDEETEKPATCNFVQFLKGAGIWDKKIMVYLLSPTDLNATTFELKDPTNVSKQIVWLGVDTAGMHSVNGMKGVLGNNNIGKPPFFVGAEFDNDNFGFTVYVNSFELAVFRADVGTFVKGPNFRLESFATATDANFVTGGGGAGLPHGGLTPHVYTFRRGNDGVRFNEHYIDGVLVGSRFNSPSDILVAPATDLRFGICGASAFLPAGGGLFSEKRIGFVMIHDNLTAQETADLHGGVVALQRSIIPGGR